MGLHISFFFVMGARAGARRTHSLVLVTGDFRRFFFSPAAHRQPVSNSQPVSNIPLDENEVMSPKSSA